MSFLRDARKWHRERVIAARINERVREICKAVPPIEPPAIHWLSSDASESYCWTCAIVARGREFELGPVLSVIDHWQRDEWQRAFFEGIDGGFDIESESVEACAICGCTLSYILTDYGLEAELSYHADLPIGDIRDEDSYALDRLALNVFGGMKRVNLLGVAIVVNRAFRSIGGAK